MTKSRRKRAIYPDWDRHRLIRLFSLWLLVLVIPLGPARAGEVTVRVGVYDNAPIVFPDGSGGYRGLAVEMLQDIASREDWKLEYVGGSLAECLERLERGDLDLQVYIAYSIGPLG
jgi:ABC-type amino acid transport substrate-binding protein